MIKKYCDICGKVINADDCLEVIICIPKIDSNDQFDHFDYEIKNVCKYCESKFRNIFRNTCSTLCR